LINFNPASDDLNEFAYLEFVDTMAYDRSKTITDYYNFFSFVSKNELLISSTNPKLGKVVENLKYEFFHFKKFPKKEKQDEEALDVKNKKLEISRRRLFAALNIMAYIFVFDYNDAKSLEEMSSLCRSIRDNEVTKTEQAGRRGSKVKRSTEFDTIKIFIGNKYPLILEDTMEELGENNKLVYPIYERDEKARAILQMLKQHFEGDESIAKQHIFFVNTKYNIGVDYAFRETFEKVLQKEALWKVLDFASDEENSEEEEVEENTNNYLKKIFCCTERDKSNIKSKTKNKKKNKDKSQSEDKSKSNANMPTDEDFHGDPFKFVEEDEEGYDENEKVIPINQLQQGQEQQIQENKKLEKNEKKGNCRVF
jgi:hypothetical protein